MPSVLLHRIRSAASLGPSPTARIAVYCDGADATINLTTPDVKELVAALVQSEKYPEVAKDAEDRLTAIWHHIGEKKVLEDKVQELESTNAEPSAAVAQMTEGVPVAWRVDGPGGIRFFSWESSARELAAQQGRTIAPLFAAAQPFPQAAELAAKVEALGKELADARTDLDDAAEIRKEAEDTAYSLRKSYESEKLAHGNTHRALGNAIHERERAQQDYQCARTALAAAEKRATDAEAARERTFHTMDGIVKERNEAWERKEKAEKRNSMLYAAAVLNKRALDAHIAESERLRIRAEKAEADRDEALTAYQAAKRARDAAEQSEAATAEGHDAWKAACEKAEARVKVLEGDAVPTGWLVSGPHGDFARTTRPDMSTFIPECTLEPLYRHPPKTGEPVVDVAAIRKLLSSERYWMPGALRAEISAAIGDR